jgi:flagellar biosynthesis protein FlhA
MEMTLQTLRTFKVRQILGGAVLPVGILALITMMGLPLPVFLLDTFFVSNILVSLLILMVAMQTQRPLEFSSFPSLILIATVLRLGLNVASTRVVLTEGHNGPDAAGKVIEAFGEFVISGNYAVGIFVFIILIIINLIVITKGAGRVSEVTARFTLDSMPGKQMAIDADLNAGILTNEEAKDRRTEIAQEADFYGAMDGSSKFVKGDAVASILILVVNIVGGLIIGLVQHNLPLSVAAENYVLLSIGDGLVAQIPSLLLAISTAIIVTRVSASHDMAANIGNQVSLSRAWIPVSGVLMLIGFVPGMPNFMFLFAALVAGFAAYWSYKREAAARSDEAAGEGDVEAEESKPDQIDLDEVADNAPISIQLGYGLISLVDDEANGGLTGRITGIRRQVSRAVGFVIPPVRIRDDLTLEANEYRIRIGQTIVGEDRIYSDSRLAIPGDDARVKLEGIEVKDPSFGMDAIWIPTHKQAEAEAKGYVVVHPESVMATHLSQVLQKYSSQLIGQDDVQGLLDNLSQSAPHLVESVVPKIVQLHTLTAILRHLLDESIPVSDLRSILENLPPLAARNLSAMDTAEALRPSLAPLLIQQIAPLNQSLPVMTLESDLEHMLITMVRQSGEEGLILDNSLAEQLFRKISETSEAMSAQGRQVVLVVSPAIRRQFSQLVRQHLDDLVVLAFTELPDSRKIEIVATIASSDEQTNNS